VSGTDNIYFNAALDTRVYRYSAGVIGITNNLFANGYLQAAGSLYANNLVVIGSAQDASFSRQAAGQIKVNGWLVVDRAGGIRWERTDNNWGAIYRNDATGDLRIKAQDSCWIRCDSPFEATNGMSDTGLPARIGQMGSYVTDLNTVYQGWISYTPTTANRPGDYYGMCFTLMVDNSNQHRRQFAYRYDSDEIWDRRETGNAWTGWRQVGSNSPKVFQAGKSTCTFDASFVGTIYFPVAFPGTPHVTFSKYNDGEYANLMLNGVSASWFQLGGVNHGEGKVVTVEWIACYP